MHPRLGQFDIVEEYTLNDNGVSEHDSSAVTDTSKNVPDESVANLSVETVHPAPAPAPVAAPKIVYSKDITDFYVETVSKDVKADDSLISDAEPVPSAYPWKKKLLVRLKRLSDFDINLWCNTQSDPGSDEALPVETIAVKQEMLPAVQVEDSNQRTSSQHKRSHVETEPDVKPTLTAPRESTAQLIARANRLIKEVRCCIGCETRCPSHLPASLNQDRQLTLLQLSLLMWKHQQCNQSVLCIANFVLSHVPAYRVLIRTIKKTMALSPVLHVEKTSKPTLPWINTCIVIQNPQPFVVKSVDRTSCHSRADLFSIRLHTHRKRVSCANMAPVIKVLKIKVTMNRHM